jgi:hypothetical protein
MFIYSFTFIYNELVIGKLLIYPANLHIGIWLECKTSVGNDFQAT